MTPTGRTERVTERVSDVPENRSADCWPSRQLKGSPYLWAILWDVQSMEDVLWECSEHAFAVTVWDLTSQSIIYTLVIHFGLFQFSIQMTELCHSLHSLLRTLIMGILTENLLWLKMNRIGPHTHTHTPKWWWETLGLQHATAADILPNLPGMNITGACEFPKSHNFTNTTLRWGCKCSTWI